MSNKRDLDTILYVRDLRVKKQRKQVRALELKINEIKRKISALKTDIQEQNEIFKKEKEKIFEELMKSKSSIQKIYDIKKKELLQMKRVDGKKSEIHQNEESMASENVRYKKEIKALWDSEKSLMKIEEYAKSEEI